MPELLHDRHDPAEDVGVTLAAVPREVGLVADVLGDEHLSRVTALEQLLHHLEAGGVVREKKRRVRVVARLVAEEVEGDEGAGPGDLGDLLDIVEGPVGVAHDDPGRIGPARLRRPQRRERRGRVTTGMDYERLAGERLCAGRCQEDPLFAVDDRPAQPDLADDARSDPRRPRLVVCRDSDGAVVHHLLGHLLDARGRGPPRSGTGGCSSRRP